MQNKKEVPVKADKKDEATVKIVVAKGSKKNAIERKTTVKEKNFLYKFQLDTKNKGLKEKELKKMRSKLRRDLQLIVNKIIIANVKKEDLKDLPDFLKFYKANYITNDFAIESITNSGDELKTTDLKKVLDLAKKYLAKK